MSEDADAPLCIIGDVHGHVQLGLCMAARWQRELSTSFDAIFLCGDVGSFTKDSELDSTTRRHGKANPCELEFLYQWSVEPQPPWLGKIFAPPGEGLGLVCHVVMVHGNHEGFCHLETLVPPTIPDEPVSLRELPVVDTGGYLHYLPSGWRCETPRGLVIGGVGGIEKGQRYADYHPMAYIDQDAVSHLLEQPPVDVLITHQGPSELQGEKGSETLQLLLDEAKAPVWFHGHSTPQKAISHCGPNQGTLVVPLEDIAFSCKGPEGDDPGENGWAILHKGSEVERCRPDFWREYRKRRWHAIDEKGLVCPDLIDWV